MGVTTWHRLEPVPRSGDMTGSLAARISDPLWMLTRQYQFGELSGEDAGSPVDAHMVAETATLDRFLAGPVSRGARNRAVKIDPADPMEALAESVPNEAAALRWRIDAGQHLMRLLRAHGAPTQQTKFVSRFPIDDVGDRPSVTPMFDVAGRVPDGVAVAEVLAAHRGSDTELTSLPAGVDVAASLAANVLAAVNGFLAWYEAAVGPVSGGARQTARTTSWNPYRLEYEFAAEASMSHGNVVVRADNYGGGHLDWYEFEADTRANLGANESSRTIERHVLPTRAFYAGMPAERFWEFEDSTVRFGSASTGRTDLAHLLLHEFAITYGNDWYVVPLRLPVGSLNQIRTMSVVDTFGVSTAVEPAADQGSSGWTMFELTLRPRAAARSGHTMMLPPAIGHQVQSEPVERVVWFRDEMANLVWAVERRVASPFGGHVDRDDEVRALGAVRQQLAAARPDAVDVGDAELIYRLNTAVADNWFPLVPVRPSGAPAGVVELELRTIERVQADGTVREPLPVSEVLNAASPLRIAEEEVGRDGLDTGMHWQLARRPNGTYALWFSHRVGPGRGEGSSGLRYDVAVPIE